MRALRASLARCTQRTQRLAASAPALQAFVLPPLFPADDPFISALQADDIVADDVAAKAFQLLRAVPSLALFECDAIALCGRRAAQLAQLAAERAVPLRALLLRGQEALTDASLALLAAACPQLEVLELTCSAVTPLGVARLLASCRRLRTLSLAHSAQLEGPGLLAELLPALRRASHLQALDLSGCALSSDFVAALPAALGARVHGLGLGDVPGMDDTLLASLRLHCPELRALDITAADDHVTPAALAALFAAPQMLALTALRSDASWSESESEDAAAEELAADSDATAEALGRARAPAPPLLHRMPRHGQSAFDDWFTRAMLLAPQPRSRHNSPSASA
jgi:hypothetical protein